MIKIPSIKGFDEQAFHKYFKNTGWLMFGKLLSLIVGLVIARYLGPAGYGNLSFATSLVAIMAAIGALGLDSFVIRELLKEPHKQNEILGTAVAMRLAVNLLLIPITVGLYLLLFSDSALHDVSLTWIIVLLSSVSLFKSFNVIDSYFQSQVQSKYVVQIQNICLFVSASIKIGLVSWGFSLTWIAAAFLIESVLLAGGLIYIFQRKGGSLNSWTYNSERAKGLLKKSFPLILSAVMISIYMKIDQVMLKEMIGSEAVGIYGAAANLSEAWFFIPVAIVTSVFPAIINARNTDLVRYKKRLVNLYDLLVVVSLPVALVVSLFANEIALLMYSEKFDGAGPILAIHIWSGVFVFFW